MYICICIHIYIYIYIHIYIYIYTCLGKSSPRAPGQAAYNAVMRACEKGERSDWAPNHEYISLSLSIYIYIYIHTHIHIIAAYDAAMRACEKGERSDWAPPPRIEQTYVLVIYGLYQIISDSLSVYGTNR